MTEVQFRVKGAVYKRALALAPASGNIEAGSDEDWPQAATSPRLAEYTPSYLLAYSSPIDLFGSMVAPCSSVKAAVTKSPRVHNNPIYFLRMYKVTLTRHGNKLDYPSLGAQRGHYIFICVGETEGDGGISTLYSQIVSHMHDNLTGNPHA